MWGCDEQQYAICRNFLLSMWCSRVMRLDFCWVLLCALRKCALLFCIWLSPNMLNYPLQEVILFSTQRGGCSATPSPRSVQKCPQFDPFSSLLQLDFLSHCPSLYHTWSCLAYFSISYKERTFPFHSPFTYTRCRRRQQPQKMNSRMSVWPPLGWILPTCQW